MFTYPLSEMLASTGVFWEHSHRLWGALVGLCVVALALAVWRFDRRSAPRWLALLALAGVCAQGVLGGLRVLENSPRLAFVHGALAQALFAVLAACVCVESPRAGPDGERRPRRAPALDRLALLAAPLVLLQSTVGAWLRHSGAELALVTHVALAFATAGVALACARELVRTPDPVLTRCGRRIRWLVGVQFALGILAAIWVYLVTGPHNPVSIGEAVFATAHVGCGALLLAACVEALVATRQRTARTAAPIAVHGRLEAAP
jgi:cytochrome c oxidase assembly protein subunit 15